MKRSFDWRLDESTTKKTGTNMLLVRSVISVLKSSNLVVVDTTFLASDNLKRF